MAMRRKGRGGGITSASAATAMRAHPYAKNQGLSLRLDKKYGQHLLKNPGVLDKIILAAEIKSTDTVLEIGPGTGNLTVRVLPLAHKVVCLDIDERMVGEVKKRSMSLGYSNLDARLGDALRSDLGRFDVCTANLPYQISAPFTFRLIAHRPLFRCAVLMFQKEFAERLLAKPSDSFYSRLTINTQLFCKVQKVCNVSPGSFNPPPKVESMVVKITPRKPAIEVDFREWDGLIRICFMRKKRVLSANFSTKSVLQMLEFNYKTYCSMNGVSPISLVNTTFKEFIQSILVDENVSQRRCVTISVDEYFKLLLAFNKKGIHFNNMSPTVERSKKEDESTDQIDDPSSIFGGPIDFDLMMRDDDSGLE